MSLEDQNSSGDNKDTEDKHPVIKALIGIKDYLTDWKNWITHGLVGVLILVIVIFTPVSIYIRLGFLLAVVIFNIVRMRISKNNAGKQTEDIEVLG